MFGKILKFDYTMKIIILTPVYNDWQSVYKLVEEINNLSLDQEFEISVYIFNDYSNHDRPDFEKNLENINSIKKDMQDVLLLG